MSISPRLLEGIVTGAAGMVAGGVTYIATIEAPARGKLSPKDQLKHWRTSFPPAAALFKPAALVLVPVMCTTAYVTGKPVYYGAAAAFGSFAPFTIAAIAATNSRLLSMKEPADEQAEQEVVTLVSRWAKRHAVRVMFATVGFGLCLYGYGTTTST